MKTIGAISPTIKIISRYYANKAPISVKCTVCGYEIKRDIARLKTILTEGSYATEEAKEAKKAKKSRRAE